MKGTAFSECKTKGATDGDKKMSGLEKKKKKTDMVSHENEELGWSPSMQDLVSKARLMSLSDMDNSRLPMPALLAIYTCL